MAKSPFQHDATRDTHFVGRGRSWWVVVAIVVAAAVLAYVLRQ
jgi:hypothetical protein